MKLEGFAFSAADAMADVTSRLSLASAAVHASASAGGVGNVSSAAHAVPARGVQGTT